MISDEENISSVCNKAIISPVAFNTPLLIASYKPLSSSEIIKLVFLEFNLIISLVLSVESPSIKTCSIYL